jgi:hypothetical protein
MFTDTQRTARGERRRGLDRRRRRRSNGRTNAYDSARINLYRRMFLSCRSTIADLENKLKIKDNVISFLKACLRNQSRRNHHKDIIINMLLQRLGYAGRRVPVQRII